MKLFLFLELVITYKKIKISLDKPYEPVLGDWFSRELSSSIFTISENFLGPELPNPETSIKIWAPRNLSHKDLKEVQDRIDFSHLDLLERVTSYKFIIDTFTILWYNIYVNKVRK